jgi:hypothetical protein
MMNKQRWRVLIACVAALSVTGCLQIETTVKLHEDGSATITERVQFSMRLLEYRDAKRPKFRMAALLEKAAVDERMKHMGKDIQLVSHKVQDGERGSRESISVFKIPKITDFRYVSPFFGKTDYPAQKALVCRIQPLYSESWTGTLAGYMLMTLASASGPAKSPPYNPGTPADRQVARNLHPMFEDMLKDFQLKFVLECYAPVLVFRRRTGGGRDRGFRTLTHRAHLIDISGENLGGGGQRFIANEEAMADVLQLFINGPHAKGNTGFGATSQLFRFDNGSLAVMFRPSRYFFDKYYEGKELNFGHSRRGKRKADFKRDGYDPKAGNDNEGKKK